MSGPVPISVPMSDIAVGNYSLLSKQVSGDLTLDSLVFYGLDESDDEGYPSSKTESKYDIEGRSVTRYYGYLGKKVDSFQGKAKFKANGKDMECPVVGLARNVNVTTREERLNYMYFFFDYSVASQPFPAVRSNSFDIFPHEKRSPFALYLDPECADLHQRYLEMFSVATQESQILQQAIRKFVRKFMKHFYLKYLIDPHRYAVEGSA